MRPQMVPSAAVRRARSILFIVAVLACAKPDGVQSSLPILSGLGGDGFESPPVERAADLLPPELLAGDHYRVADDVKSDGFRRVYRIESDFGEFEAVGDDMVAERVREVEALVALEALSGTSEFAESTAKGLAVPFVAAWNLVRHPVDTLTGLPVAAWEQVKRIDSISRNERSEYEENAWRAFIGFAGKKRELAAGLGVDPYSSNPVLQRELNRAAWAEFSGGAVFQLIPFQTRRSEREDEAPDLSLMAPDRLQELLLSYPPQDLERFNRIELAVMGISEEQRKSFLGHRWYSPRLETILILSLAALDPALQRNDFLKVAATAVSEGDARYYQNAAQLLRAYHEGAAPIERIFVVDGWVGAYSYEGTLVIPLPADYAVWTRPVSEAADAIAGAVMDSTEAGEAELVVSGSLSERAREGFRSREIAVVENAFERLRPEPVATR